MNRQFSLGKNKSSNPTPANKRWVHPPEALLNGHLVYNVKFLGEVEVDQPKGTEVVKEAIRKMKFNKQIKKAEGQKPPKVELAVSMNGVTIQDPKTKIVQGQHPLHRISYCADDKSDKRMFTFISKDADSNTHNCYVFDSEKCAEQITLTIGQAFDLAYKKFLESSNKDLDTKKQYLLLQKKAQQLTQENQELRERVATLEALVPPNVLREHNKNTQNNNNQKEPSGGAVEMPALLFDEEINTTLQTSPMQTNGAHTAFFTPNRPPQTSRTQGMPTLPPPPVPSRTGTVSSPPPGGSQVTSPQQTTPAEGLDLFGATPFTAVTSPTSPPMPVAQSNPFAAPAKQDPFGMTEFNPSSSDLDRQIQNVDKELMDLQAGFSQGLSFADDFSLADLDPLSRK